MTEDGTPLVVLGRPSSGEEEDKESESLLRTLRGTLVVLLPSGIPALHLPAPLPGRPDFISPWDLGWTPITDPADWGDWADPDQAP